MQSNGFHQHSRLLEQQKWQENVIYWSHEGKPKQSTPEFNAIYFSRPFSILNWVKAATNFYKASCWQIFAWLEMCIFFICLRRNILDEADQTPRRDRETRSGAPSVSESLHNWIKFIGSKSPHGGRPSSPTSLSFRHEKT